MSNTANQSHIRFGIRKKLLLSVILMTLLICAVSTLSGYYQYSDTIRKLYNDNGYVIANVIMEQIDPDKIGLYAQTWQEDEDYAEMAKFFIRIMEYAEKEDNSCPARLFRDEKKCGDGLWQTGSRLRRRHAVCRVRLRKRSYRNELCSLFPEGNRP